MKKPAPCKGAGEIAAQEQWSSAIPTPPLPQDQVLAQLALTIKVLIEKGNKARAKADQFFISAGQHLKMLKARHDKAGGNWADWEELVKTEIGIGKSRASELMQIADGRNTVADVKLASADRKARERANLSVTSRRKTSPSTSHAVAVVKEPDEEEQSFLDDDGGFIPDDPEASARLRIKGFLYRAEQSALGAHMEWKGIVCTKEMLEAAREAAAAWAQTCRELEVANSDNIEPQNLQATERLAQELEDRRQPYIQRVDEPSPTEVPETPVGKIGESDDLDEIIPVFLRRCDHCGQPARPAEPLQHWDWKHRPDGIWLHERCESAWHDGKEK